MLDGRGWELVSPEDKHGASVEALPKNGAIIMAAAGGGAITWVSNGSALSEPQGNRSPELGQLLSVREGGEWRTQSLETPHDRGSGLEVEPVPVEYQDFSSDLALGLVAPAVPINGRQTGLVEAPPLSPEASEKTVYLRDDPPLEPQQSESDSYEGAGSEANRDYLSPGYLPLVNQADDTAKTQFGGELEFVGASPDLSHVLLSSGVGLLAGDPSGAGLYEWSAGTRSLALVSVLPERTPGEGVVAASDPYLGDGESQSNGGGLNSRGAVSADGSRVFWTDGKEHLYMYDAQTGKSIQVNSAQGQGATEPGSGGQPCQNPKKDARKCTSRWPAATVRGCSSPTPRA